VRCIGVDLGWTSGASGVALLESEGLSNPRFMKSASILELDDLVAWIAEHAGDNCVVAVDAPLRIRNSTGMREAEKVAHRLYGRQHAGCYPANLASKFASRTTGFSLKLASLGFVHTHERTARRIQFECFPHIAAVEFFGLDQIVKYKRGLRAKRLFELRRLSSLIAGLPIQDLQLPELPEQGNLKPAEDQLDAILCAYAAHYWSKWGLERNRVLGDPEEGCMIVPWLGRSAKEV
jgi:predicted RNase H-like nuclease